MQSLNTVSFVTEILRTLPGYLSRISIFFSFNSVLIIAMVLGKAVLLQGRKDYNVRKERSFLLSEGHFITKHGSEDERVFSYGRFTPHTLLENLHLKGL